MFEFIKESPVKIKGLIVLFCFCYLIILFRVITVPLYEDGKQRDSIHGDAYSDKNAHSTGLYYYDFGFDKYPWLPVWNYTGNGDTSQVWVYTHYPAIPDMLTAVYSVALDTKSDALIRVFPVLLSVVFFFLIFNVLGSVLPDKNAAFVSAAILVASNYFIFWADNLHKHLYEELLKWAYFFALYSYYKNESGKKVLIVACGLIFIVVINISFEPVTYLAVLTVGMSWIYKRKIFSWENIFLGAMPIIGFGIHFYQNILYFGSAKIALTDMTDAATLRTVGNNSSQNEMKRSLEFLDYLEIPFMWLRRIERFFLIAGPAFCYFAYLGLKEIKKADLKLFQLGIVLILATLSWNLAMTQHSLVHAFTTRHLGIFYGFVVGYGLLSYAAKVKEDYRHGKLYQKALHVGFIGYILVMMVSQQLYDYLRYGILYLSFHS